MIPFIIGVILGLYGGWWFRYYLCKKDCVDKCGDSGEIPAGKFRNPPKTFGRGRD